jgi:hypothetical protein
MKKYVLIAAAGLLTTAGVTAAMLEKSPKKVKTESVQKAKKDCPYKKCCSRMASSTACY